MLFEQSKVVKNFMITVLPLCAVKSTEFTLPLKGLSSLRAYIFLKHKQKSIYLV